MRRAALALVVAAAGASAQERTEVGILPGVAYSTDTGLGLGVGASIAGVAPDVEPFRWRMQLQLYASAKTAPGGGIELVTHDDSVDLDLPRLAGGLLRWRGRLAFTRNVDTGWYGLGNATVDDPVDGPRYYNYRRTQERLQTDARVRLAGALEAYGALRTTVTGIGVYPGSLLERDRERLVAVEDHGELLFSAGIVVDTRDHELAPSWGAVLELGARGGAGLGAPFGYYGATAEARAFVPIVGERAVLAVRLLGDLLGGNPPFDELARHGGLSPSDATGGGSSLRGVPAQRYHGRGKILGNTELRLRVVPFDIGGTHFFLGGLVFVDAGRVFEGDGLDGDSLGLHLGLGGGLRLEWGTTFVVRADAAASPEGTSGLYIDVGHVF
jgi:hypothetical protein